MNAIPTAPRPGTPLWLRLLALLLLAWNAFGLWVFFQQMTMSPADLARMTEAQRQLFEAMPGWIWMAYGVAVGAGSVGALALLLGRRLALPLFVVSLVAVLAQCSQVFYPGGALQALGPKAALPLPLTIIAVAIFQVWLARRATIRDWLA